jgi:hypothetical protein
MRTAGNKRTETAQGQSNICHSTKATKGADTAPLTQAELLAWWPFERLDPKRFPKTVRNHDVEDALL